MARGYLAWDLLNLEAEIDADLADMEEVEEERVARRALRDVMDPFDCPEKAFRSFFRLSRELAWDLCEWLRPALERERRHGLTAEKQVLAALRFFATGSNQGAVGQDLNIAFSQSAISRAIRDVAEAIENTLLREHVKFPQSVEERAAVKESFENCAQPFVGTLGAIDCTHVAIIRPRDHEDQYLNHHGYHSMNVQMVCDSKYIIQQVCARFPGRRHDAFIWSASALRRNMMSHYAQGERHTWLIGDSGYRSEPWLLTPIPDAEPGTPEFRYTEAYCKARAVIEMCFGILKGTWNCLSKRRVLLYDPVSAGRIINACVVLHNLRLKYNIEAEEEEIVNEEDEGPRNVELAEEVMDVRERLAEGRRVRDAFIRRYFS